MNTYLQQRQCLMYWLVQQHLPGMMQFQHELELFEQAPDKKRFVALFSRASRLLPRTVLHHADPEKLQASSHFAGWFQSDTTFDQIGRLLLLITANHLMERHEFLAGVDGLFNSAEMGELVVLYRSLCFFDGPEYFVGRAREGARSNMHNVFQAIALHNQYPSCYFDDEGWNQLILKAVFNAYPLADIIGLDERNNPALSHMLCDYVREQKAARRKLNWDIWRGIGACVKEADDIRLLTSEFEDSDIQGRLAAALAFKSNHYIDSEKVLEHYPEIAREINAVSWSTIASIPST